MLHMIVARCFTRSTNRTIDTSTSKMKTILRIYSSCVKWSQRKRRKRKKKNLKKKEYNNNNNIYTRTMREGAKSYTSKRTEPYARHTHARTLSEKKKKYKPHCISCKSSSRFPWETMSKFRWLSLTQSRSFFVFVHCNNTNLTNETAISTIAF